MKIVQTIDYSEAKEIIDTIVEKALEMQKAAVIAEPREGSPAAPRRR